MSSLVPRSARRLLFSTLFLRSLFDASSPSKRGTIELEENGGELRRVETSRLESDENRGEGGSEVGHGGGGECKSREKTKKEGVAMGEGVVML